MAKGAFVVGNQAARAKRGKAGPRIVKLKGKPGYYIRWYELRSNVIPLRFVAILPHELDLQPAREGGVVVMKDPGRRNPYHRVLKAADVIVEVAGFEVNTPAEFEEMIAKFDGKTIRMNVNRGGKHGTTPRFMKAGGTKEQAQESLARWMESKRARKDGVADQKVTFAQLAQEYLQWADTLGGYSPTWRKDVELIAKHHIERWGAWQIAKIPPAEFGQWAERRYRESSYYTVYKELHVLRSMFKLAQKRRYTKASPVQDIKLRRPPAQVPKYLTEQEIAKLLEIARQKDKERLRPRKPKPGKQLLYSADNMLRYYNLDGTFDSARIRFLLLSALRKSQFTDLTWKQFDPARGTITLQASERHSEKSRRVTVIPLPQAAIEIIKGQPKVCEVIFPNFSGERDGQIHKRFLRIAREFKKQTGKRVHLHMLRHTSLTYLLQHSKDIALVSKYAGHRKVETTQIYAHILEQRMREATKDFDITVPRAGKP